MPAPFDVESSAVSRRATASRRVVIRGLGLVSPLGVGAWATFADLLAGRSIADRALKQPEDIAVADLIQVTGGVAVARHTPTDPAVEIAERAAREALAEAEVAPEGLPMLLGTSKGAVTALTAAADDIIRQRGIDPAGPRRGYRRPPTPPPQDMHQAVALGPHGYLTWQLARRLGCEPRGHHVAACASSLVALHHAREQLARSDDDADADGPQPRRMLVVTSEAALLPVFIHSYARLGVLAQQTPAGYAGRPLDRFRRGFMLAELGAAVLLEALPAGAAPKPGQIELLDTAVGSDPHDMIRPAPGMPGLQAVADALLTGRPIDLLHPHAPGTPDQDPAELAVYNDRLTQTADAYACKGALGHGLGAAGLVALVLACLCARTGRRPPMPWLEDPIELDDPKINLTAAPPPKRTLSTHAIFAAGFGGHIAGAVIQRH